MNEYKLMNDIEQFKVRVQDLPLDDVLYYQEQFTEEVLKEYNVEIVFEDGKVIY